MEKRVYTDPETGEQKILEVDISEIDQEIKSGNNGVRRPNINDKAFWESLECLAKCRDLLSIEEENLINNLANKFKYIR